MNASTHHRHKLTILTVSIYLKDTSIAATHRFFLSSIMIHAEQLCCSFSVFLRMINQHWEAIYVFQCTFQHTHSAHNTINISYPYGAPCKLHKNKPYIFGLKILSILCMQRHDFAIAVKGATSERGWVCLSNTPCSKCLRSCSAAGSPNQCINMKLRVYQLDNICSSHS